jgi:hypothetical protein
MAVAKIRPAYPRPRDRIVKVYDRDEAEGVLRMITIRGGNYSKDEYEGTFRVGDDLLIVTNRRLALFDLKNAKKWKIMMERVLSVEVADCRVALSLHPKKGAMGLFRKSVTTTALELTDPKSATRLGECVRRNISTGVHTSR